MTVRQLLDGMDRDELADWQALMMLEGEERDVRDAERRANTELEKQQERMRRR